MIYKNWILNRFQKLAPFKESLKLLDDKSYIRISGLFGSSLSYFSHLLSLEQDNPILLISGTDEEAKNLILDLEALGVERAYYFPSLDTTPYQSSVINDEVSSQRLDVLTCLLKGEVSLISTSIEAAAFHITPKEFLEPYFFDIKKGESYPFEEFTQKLIHSGFNRVKTVAYPGEFAVRGDIIDIYYSSLKNPVRLEFFDDEVESIRSFSAGTQTSSENLEAITVAPYKEIVYGEAEIAKAKERLEELNGAPEIKSTITEKIENYNSFDGEHYYLNLFYEKSMLSDYFEDVTIVINDYSSVKQKYSSFKSSFKEYFHDTINFNKPKVDYEDMLYSLDEVIKSGKKVVEANLIKHAAHTDDVDFKFKGIPVYLGNMELFKEDMRKYREKGYKVIIFAVNEQQTNRLKTIFQEFDPEDDRFDFQEKSFSLYPLYLANGFVMEKEKVLLLNDYEILGRKNRMSRHFYTKRTEVIDSFIDLKPGDYIVHIQHGIGKFLGIERVKSMGVEKDYISIQYADGDKIFIPIEQLNFVQKYTSGELSSPKLDRIGGKSWSKKKEKVKKSVDELAEELVKLYSYRLDQKGFAFENDTPWQKEFEAKFPYDETEDQILTIEEVKRDMESTSPMDRLICGDVGFGKTEVAIRAAFKAVMSGKQVVILVPTTILAEQHYETFFERLRGYPIKVEMLSRFREAEQQKKIISQLGIGEVDVIIGTHRLLSKDVIFKNPGLLIIDEEHRFGVKHKEKVKQMKKNLDCLSMTATPIPRTLHMSLSSIRDMSVINTPPKERHAVETYVMEFNADVFRKGVIREMARKGQVFFLYNRVKTIYEMKRILQGIVPEARIVVAHGQMVSEVLEDVIHSFINYEYDILLTTTIIETGIDIPRVNTIFIDKADKFGLAQLYQLRGRVGRSTLKAYAYLFHEPERPLTEEAMKRLRVISEHTELGSGFKVAMKDMEIRGAGNLLGPEQHGDILAVGFSLYCKLLSDSIKKLKKEKKIEGDLKDIEDELEVFLDLEYKGFIPDSYISDPKQKIEIYKKVSQVVHEEEIRQLTNMLEDRFGQIPEEVTRLLYLANIRILCKKMKIVELMESGQENKYGERTSTVEVKFSDSSKINLTKVMGAVATSEGKIFLKGDKPQSVFIKIEDELELQYKGEHLSEVLESFI